jgi:hypothetical protein
MTAFLLLEIRLEDTLMDKVRNLLIADVDDHRFFAIRNTP